MTALGSEAQEIGDKKKDESSRMALYDWVQCIVTAVVCGILIFTFLGRIDGIQGPSMMQTLQNGDRVVLSNPFFHTQIRRHRVHQNGGLRRYTHC